ncbi:MAG: hypothetical protein ACR2MX_02605 [Cyclobacteriaceae bacterium]
MQDLEKNYIPYSATKPRTHCGHCFQSLSSEDRYCHHCGFPQGGSNEEKHRFISEIHLKKADLTQAQQMIRNAAATLYVIACFTALYGLIVGLGIQDDARLMIGNLVIAILYLVLGLWSQEKPFISILCGLILFVTFILLNAFLDPDTLYKGIIIKAIVTVFLIRGVISARKANRILSELPTEKKPII